MTVTEHIKQANDTLISFEILPPLKGKGMSAIYEHLDPLMEFKPSWINVTYHRTETAFKKRADGSFEKVEVLCQSVKITNRGCCTRCKGSRGHETK